MITREQASEVVESQEAPGNNQSYAMAWYDGMLAAVEVLDRAGAFPSEATLADIANVARTILEDEAAHPGSFTHREDALRLASACRAAGLVKP